MIMNVKKRRVLAVLMLIVITVALTMQVACNSDKVSVTFTAVFYDGTTRTEKLNTSKATLGEALEEKGYIETRSDGLVVTVFGKNYDDLATSNSMVYWAFYIGDEYATVGVFDAKLTDGAVYTMKAETYSW